MKTLEQRLIQYFRKLGLKVCTDTKARGHQGFFIKSRIDISKNISKERRIPVLLHEFTHYIHSQIEPDMLKTGGSLNCIFDSPDTEIYNKELLKVTNSIENSSKCEKLINMREIIKIKQVQNETVIKARYPKFKRSEKFREFDKYIRKSKAKHLLKYDRVKIVSGLFFKKIEILSIDTISRDFPKMPKEFVAYINLKSLQRRRARISAKISRLQKYYSKPTELFARFVESLYLSPEQTKSIAPTSYNRFFNLLNSGYYRELKNVFEIINYPLVSL